MSNLKSYFRLLRVTDWCGFFLIALFGFVLSDWFLYPVIFLLDILSHGLFSGTLLFFLPLIIFNSELSLFHYLIGLSVFWFSAIIELKNHLRDYEGDKKAELKTTVCVLGKERSELLLKFLESFYPLTIFPIFLFSENLILIMLFAIISCLSLIKKNNTINKYVKLPYNLLQKFIIAIWEISKLVF